MSILRPLNLLAIVPCRKGSKSVSQKNLQVINPRNMYNLIQRTVLLAQKSKLFKEILVTTDIRRGAIPVGCTVIERPKELATDDALMEDVVIHALSRIKTGYDYFVLLQPSSPFRTLQQFADIKWLLQNKVKPPNGQMQYPKSLISFTDVKQNHPNRMHTEKNGLSYPLSKTNFKNKQDLKPSEQFFVEARDKKVRPLLFNLFF